MFSIKNHFDFIWNKNDGFPRFTDIGLFGRTCDPINSIWYCSCSVSFDSHILSNVVQFIDQ